MCLNTYDMMKTIIKPHPLRDIVLEFDDAVQPPAFEQEALSQYYNAHDATFALSEHAKKQIVAVNEAKDILDDLTLRRLNIDQELDFLEEGLGVKVLDSFDYSVDLKFTIDFDTFFGGVLQHNDDLKHLYNLVSGLTKQYNTDIGKIYEDDYLIEPIYFTVPDDLYERYEELSLNVVSLDRDHQCFLGAYKIVDDEYWKYLDDAKILFDGFSTNVRESEAIYRRVEHVDTVIRKIADDNPFGKGFSGSLN